MKENIIPDFDIEIDEFKFIGRGPNAINLFSTGWSRDDNILYRCANCGSTMGASFNDYWSCKCKAVHLDIGASRFGSQYGDKNILVYKKKKLSFSIQKLKSLFHKKY